MTEHGRNFNVMFSQFAKSSQKSPQTYHDLGAPPVIKMVAKPRGRRFGGCNLGIIIVEWSPVRKLRESMLKATSLRQTEESTDPYTVSNPDLASQASWTTEETDS